MRRLAVVVMILAAAAGGAAAQGLETVAPGSLIRLELRPSSELRGRLVSHDTDTVRLFLRSEGRTAAVPRAAIGQISSGTRRSRTVAALRWGIPLALGGAVVGAVDCRRDVPDCREGYGLPATTGDRQVVVRAGLTASFAAGGAAALIAALRPGTTWRPLENPER